MWIASFDIGKKNFAFCVENTNTCFKTFQEVCTTGCIELLENIDLTNGQNKKHLDIMIYCNMYKYLEQYKEYWDKCSIIIIEQQMSFGRKTNIQAVKLAQHCYSFFIHHYATFKVICEFPSYHKTKVFGASGLSKYQRKQWAITKAIEILQLRGETEILSKLQGRHKKDDMSDVILQVQAYKAVNLMNPECEGKREVEL